MPEQKIEKGNVLVLALAVGAAALAAAGIIVFFAAGYELPSNMPVAKIPPAATKEAASKTNLAAENSNPVDWKTYQSADKKLEFEYPAEKLSLSQETEKITLSHSVPFRHADPCDMRDGAKDLADIPDFEVKVQYVKNNLADAVVAAEPAFFVEDYLDQSRSALKISPQYIDQVEFRDFSGYKITNSVEGCGEYVYYLVLDPQNTLRVSRLIVAEFQPVNTDYRENLKIPGIIKPEAEEKLFEQIMSSLKFRSGDSAPSGQVVPE